jgi:FolB domain-containing protein
VTDEVEISGLRVLGHHGALEGEQDRAQPFELDIVFTYDMDAAARSSTISARCDRLRGVTSRAARVVSEQRFALLEALGDAVARAVLEDPGSPRSRSGCTSCARRCQKTSPRSVSCGDALKHGGGARA